MHIIDDDNSILASISGADQEDLTDEAAEAALNGEYSEDKADREELDVLMDADEDEDELAEMFQIFSERLEDSFEDDEEKEAEKEGY